LLVEIAHGALSDVRSSRALDTRPTRMFLNGLVSGALSRRFGAPLEARELPGAGSHRVVVAPAGELAGDLEDPRLTAPVESFAGVLIVEA
jgi:hypothetical protein